MTTFLRHLTAIRAAWRMAILTYRRERMPETLPF